MKKHHLIIVFTVALSILIYVLIQLTRFKDFDHNESSIKYIPTNAGIIIKARSLSYLKQQLNEQIDFADELNSSELIKSALSPFSLIDSLNQIEGFSLNDLSKHPVYISIHGQGKNSVKTQYIIELQNKKESAAIIDFIENTLSKRYTITQRKYNSANIFEVKDNIKNSAFVCVKEGLTIISESALLIEATLRQMDADEDWTTSDSFQKVKKTAGAGSNINIYINFSSFAEILSPITNPKANSQIEKIKKQSEWGELDLEVKNNSLLFNGFLTEGSDGIFSTIISNSKTTRRNILQFIPSNTNAYITLSLNKGEDFNKKLSTYYQENNQTNPITTFEKKNKIEFRNIFFELLSDELAIAYDGNNQSKNGLLVISLKSQSDAEKSIKELLVKTGNSSTPLLYKPDDGLSYNIYKSFQEPVFEMLFGSFLSDIPNNYFTFYKNNLVIADNPKQLEQFLYNNILNKTLKYNKIHQEFLDNFSSKDNLFVFAKAGALPQTTEHFLKPLWTDINRTQSEYLSNFYAIGGQFSETGNMIYSTVFLQYLPDKISEPETIWQSLLDTLAITKPTLVLNHYSNEKEVIIQDANYNLYLMNNNGRMLWKKPLEEPILGEITQIDYYRNNKLQYIFNTPSKIYVLDRNGNHVDNFPIKLPSKATNGIAVVDYDNNMNYRFFISCENKKVYLYNKKGNIIPGWKFNGSEGLVQLPIQHFRSNNKDYIVFADNRRNYILDRKGNIRVPIKNDFISNSQSPFYLINKNQSNDAIVTSSKDGQIKTISLKTGEVKSTDIGQIDSNHKLSVFHQGNRENYLISESQKITILNNRFNEVFEKKFDHEINTSVDLYQFSSQITKFGVSELNGNKIFLINGDGSVYKGFPLIGKSRFSIGFLKSSSVKFNLIVAGVNNYLYNYRVE
ncbi:hypothetical protein [Carboxylicivirga caseinilyticus]|uniref:hypothetical protein n=1 Tax=Carboxylicivirga caseinilyticus TaxID=3417572 RepID=UPI003D3590A0|nr:hypothetical protein [Marinilabiliaceae bacterium A049]